MTDDPTLNEILAGLGYTHRKTEGNKQYAHDIYAPDGTFVGAMTAHECVDWLRREGLVPQPKVIMTNEEARCPDACKRCGHRHHSVRPQYVDSAPGVQSLELRCQDADRCESNVEDARCPECGWPELLTEGGSHRVSDTELRSWQHVRCKGPACGWEAFEDWSKEASS
jgi:hypothetical protein